ncbi:MAG: phosphoribosyltransferase family protein [Caulobacteraceae bacterium]|nr:phosphoribosyltransferase family protein [Caulobacteraceae bacterium]
MSFVDRSDAGRRLAKALARYRDQDPVVLALPRGGVPVAALVADALGAELDLVMVRKIGAPFDPELAMGAVVDGAEPITVRNEDVIAMVRADPATFDRIRDRELAEIRRRRDVYLGQRGLAAIAGRTAIVIDDGVATGATMRAALRAVRARAPKTLVLAAPVAARDTLEALRPEADAVVCLESPTVFGGVGQFYANFGQVSDQTVIDILASHPLRPGGSKS